ncbi:MAG TPA: hypothetical protein VMJ10_29130 [Kofleriaceae bacterium]|nr:hypothetical protein [Kofleriaceae bacterium]
MGRIQLGWLILGACGGGANGMKPHVDASAPDPDGFVVVPPGTNGNPDGHCALPPGALAEDVSMPTTVVGTGTPASCTADEVVAAVHAGGVVTFDCGTAPLTIVVPEIDIFNDGGKGDGSVTIDGGGLITLSGGGANRILYQNTCDQNLHYTTPHCQDQPAPHLVVQNIGFTAGSANATSSVLGGGAMYVGGGTFKAYNVRFDHSTQPNLEQDYAGGAIYTFNQATQPVYIVSSTFDTNSGCSGGALGSIGTSYSILNSVFSNNMTLGNGENPAKPGTPGGGLGGAIYNDGNSYTLSICGTSFTTNTAAELGSGTIFQVVDDLNGQLVIDQSAFTGNSNTGSVQSASHPSIYVEAMDKQGNAGVTITATTFH